MNDQSPLSRSEAAKLLNISLAKFDTLRKTKPGPNGTKVGRELRFSVEDVLVWRGMMAEPANAAPKPAKKI